MHTSFVYSITAPIVFELLLLIIIFSIFFFLCPFYSDEIKLRDKDRLDESYSAFRVVIIHIYYTVS